MKKNKPTLELVFEDEGHFIAEMAVDANGDKIPEIILTNGVLAWEKEEGFELWQSNDFYLEIDDVSNCEDDP